MAHSFEVKIGLPLDRFHFLTLSWSIVASMKPLSIVIFPRVTSASYRINVQIFFLAPSTITTCMLPLTAFLNPNFSRVRLSSPISASTTCALPYIITKSVLASNPSNRSRDAIRALWPPKLSYVPDPCARQVLRPFP